MAYIKVEPLPYEYNALEPHIDEQTMRIHHDKHYATYVEKYNDAVKGTEFENKPLHEVLANECRAVPDKIRTVVRNNGGGAHNHAHFWEMMTPSGGGAPRGRLADAIQQQLGGLEKFKKDFIEAGKNRFGSGWAWLVIEGSQLKVTSTANQDSPIMFGQKPLLGVDVWEHAYYLKYQNRRPDYLEAWWNTVNWDFVAERYDQAGK
jgi:Fe-Mn family superoxide dismutase